jgi:hypothetical protein
MRDVKWSVAGTIVNGRSPSRVWRQPPALPSPGSAGSIDPQSIALDRSEVEDQLYAAAMQNGLLAEDGQRQTSASIRSGLSAGLRSPFPTDGQ